MSKLKVLKLKSKLKNQMHHIQTLDLLRQIAISEFHHLEYQKDKASEFILNLGAFFNFYEAKKIHFDDSPESAPKLPCIVAITSDEGFLGVLNNHIITKFMELRQEFPSAKFVVLGSKGARRLKEAGVEAIEFSGIPFPFSYEAILPLQNYLMEKYSTKEIASVRIVYARCHSLVRQTVEVAEILPFNILDLSQRSKPKLFSTEESDYVIVEPNANQIIEYTVSLCFQRQLYEIFWNSKLSEAAARTVEFNERCQKFSKELQKVKIQYFKACHEVIDEGIQEVFASINFSKQMKKALELESP